METFLYIVHGVICLALILLVLLQQGKGAGVGFSMGGASQAMFGGSGGRDFFIKLTAGLALGFMLICIVVAKMAVGNAGQYRGALSGAETTAPAAATAPATVPMEAAPAAAVPVEAAKPVVPAPAQPAPVAPAQPK